MLAGTTVSCTCPGPRTPASSLTAARRRAEGRVLSFLMKHIHHERRDILCHNMELLCIVLELWGPAVQEYVELDIVASLLSSREPGVEGSGVQVLTAALASS